MSKVWLGIITSDKEFENIDELTRDIYMHFDGICAVVHKQGGDNRVKEMLESRKGGGVIVERPYLFQHSHSMNEWLFQPQIKLNDFCFTADSSERFNPAFSKNIKIWCTHLESRGINTVFQYSKLWGFRRWFNQQFFGGLHWGLNGFLSNIININEVPSYEDPKTYFYSLRNEKRSKDHRYFHECKYIIEYGANGNHLALFWNNPQDLAYHQIELYKFLCLLENLNIKTVDDWGEWLKSHSLTREMRHHINLERPFRNYYRYYILGHTHEDILKDEDTWRI